MAWAARELGERAALVGAASIAFGTLLLPYAAQLYGHVLASALAFGAWCLLRARPPTARRTVVAGLLLGTAVTVEYQTAIILVVAATWLLVRHRRRIGWLVLGGIPPALALVAYQLALVGSPFTSTYSQKEHHEATPLITGIPKPLQGLEILFGSRGILLFTPIVGVGVWGLVQLVRRRTAQYDDAFVGLAVIGLFFLLQSGWGNPWGGEMPGPRYMIPALPFLALGVAAVYRDWARGTLLLAAWSTFSMAWPLVARHLVSKSGWLIADQMNDVSYNGFMPTLFTMAMGWTGWLVHLVLLGVVLWLVAREVRRLPPDPLLGRDA
jgi:hypothetical protein